MADHIIYTGITKTDAEKIQVLTLQTKSIHEKENDGRVSVDELKGNARLHVFFSADTLAQLLANSSPKGMIEFYPTLDESGAVTIAASESESEVKEIGVVFLDDEDAPIPEPISTEYTAQTIAFNGTNPEEMLTRFQNRNEPWLFRKVSFSYSQLSTLHSDSSGINLYTSLMEFKGEAGLHYTLSAVPEGDEPGVVVSSLLPCPPNCGDGSYQNKSKHA